MNRISGAVLGLLLSISISNGAYAHGGGGGGGGGHAGGAVGGGGFGVAGGSGPGAGGFSGAGAGGGSIGGRGAPGPGGGAGFGGTLPGGRSLSHTGPGYGINPNAPYGLGGVNNPGAGALRGRVGRNNRYGYGYGYGGYGWGGGYGYSGGGGPMNFFDPEAYSSAMSNQENRRYNQSEDHRRQSLPDKAFVKSYNWGSRGR